MMHKQWFEFSECTPAWGNSAPNFFFREKIYIIPNRHGQQVNSSNYSEFSHSNCKEYEELSQTCGAGDWKLTGHPSTRMFKRKKDRTKSWGRQGTQWSNDMEKFQRQRMDSNDAGKEQSLWVRPSVSGHQKADDDAHTDLQRQLCMCTDLVKSSQAAATLLRPTVHCY